MKISTLPQVVIRNNYLQLLFVFVAFILMIITSFFFIGRILQNRLLSEADQLLYSAESNVKAGLSEAETTLLNSYYAVQNMIERKVSRKEILNYLTLTTQWMRKPSHGLMSYNGIYGYINGEFYDGIGLKPGKDYIPQTMPWYQAGVRSGKFVSYTVPYRDLRTGNTIVSVVRNIDINNGDMVGILAVDIDIDWLVKYIGSIALAPGGYGMLLNQNLTLITHPDSTLVGYQLQDLGGAYQDIADTLRSGGKVSAAKITNPDGSSAIVFFKHIFNKWYIGIVTPQNEFYQDLYKTSQILTVLGLILALLLSFILWRLSAERTHAVEKSMNLEQALIKTMAELVECRDGITGGHIDRTQRGVKILLDEIKKHRIYYEQTKDWDIDLITRSSQLHDIGKISIEDRILKKPGKLDDVEFEEMKKHTTFGEKIITKIETMTKENDFLKYAKILAVSHHEKWDGTGYPKGLKEHDIPLLGRIMAIADVYDALVSDRSYKEAFTHEEAVRIIAENKEKHFDPHLIEIFLGVSDRFK
jgi:hypothetical protein